MSAIAESLDKSDFSSEPTIEEEFIHKNDQDKDYMPHLDDEIYIAYKWRWINLLLFALGNMLNMVAWISITPISTGLETNYNVDAADVNNLSLAYQAIYVVFTFPSTYFIDSYGVRKSTILGIFLTAAGMGIKCFVGLDRFYILFIGQCVCALGSPFLSNA